VTEVAEQFDVVSCIGATWIDKIGTSPRSGAPVDDWLRQNPDDPDAGAIDEWNRPGQRSYLSVDRRSLGWGVFVLRNSRS
jgi:hypothetical protein